MLSLLQRIRLKKLIEQYRFAGQTFFHRILSGSNVNQHVFVLVTEGGREAERRMGVFEDGEGESERGNEKREEQFARNLQVLTS